jgi:hypothetical protein
MKYSKDGYNEFYRQKIKKGDASKQRGDDFPIVGKKRCRPEFIVVECMLSF